MRISDWSSDVCSSDLIDGDLLRIAKVDGPRLHSAMPGQSNKAIYQIGHIAEGARLASIAIHSDRVPGQCLHHDVRHHPAIHGRKPRAISVENAGHTDSASRRAVIIESKRLRRSFAFIVAGARTGWIDIAEIILPLRMDLRIAINLAGGCEEEVRSTAFSQGQQVLRADHAGHQRMFWIGLV